MNTRKPGSHASWIWRVVPAAFLGVLAIPLWMLLGIWWEGLRDHGIRVNYHLFLIIGFGAYFLMSQFLLSYGDPQGFRKGWAIVLVLNFPYLVLILRPLIAEPTKVDHLDLYLACVAVACSCAGTVLAARIARRRVGP